jgi:small subunit ribosomal protein S8
MSMNDPLSDMLARIRNGQSAGKSEIEVLYSKLLANVCASLTDEGYIKSFRVEDRGNNKKSIMVELKYVDGKGAIRQIDRVSKPGRRVYSGAKTMPRFYNGLGVLILSTPGGVMTDHKARTANVGGEVLCQVF